MIIFPAIDLRNGQCVRLLRGDPNAQTTYGDDPPGVAEQFAEQGAEWLHVINLDGAFGAAALGVAGNDVLMEFAYSEV